MNKFSQLAFAGAALVVLTATAVTAWRVQGNDSGLPILKQGSRPVFALLQAQPFRLEESYTHWYRAEQPSVSAGYLLVLDVDPDQATPRQLAEPVLYVGAETAERVNHGHTSGTLVVIVPAQVGADGLPQLELDRVPIFYGSPRLPERVTHEIALGELAEAEGQGIGPFSSADVDQALAIGGGLLELADKTALERRAAQLVLELAPGEEELARALLSPLDR